MVDLGIIRAPAAGTVDNPLGSPNGVYASLAPDSAVQSELPTFLALFAAAQGPPEEQIDLPQSPDNEDGTVMPLPGKSLPLDEAPVPAVFLQPLGGQVADAERAGPVSFSGGSNGSQQRPVVSAERLVIEPPAFWLTPSVARQTARSEAFVYSERQMPVEVDGGEGPHDSTRPVLFDRFLNSATTSVFPRPDGLERLGSPFLTRLMGSAHGPSPGGLRGPVEDPELFSSLLSSAAAVSGGDRSVPQVQLPVNAQLGQFGWGEEVSGRILWAVKSNIRVAELHIQPPELGPIEVRLVLSKDHTQVSFLTQHVAVRDALEAAVPKLRDALGDAGLTNVSVDINHHSPGRRESGAESWSDHPRGASADIAESAAPESSVKDTGDPALVRVGMIDLYV